MPQDIYDAIIVGGGPAGLSTAMVLGRCRRKVLVFDTGEPRNKVARAIHGFPTRDGTDPGIFLNTLKKELRTYAIGIMNKEVVKARKQNRTFMVTTADGTVYRSLTLLLATGLVDTLPPLPGIEKYYGRGVYHCAYCDGWENRDKRWVLCATSARGALVMAAKLRNWTSDVTVLAAYARGFTGETERILKRNGIGVSTSSVQELRGRHSHLSSIVFSDGSTMPCDALFFATRPRQHSDLAEQLACRFTRRGNVDFNRFQQTNVEGLYVAGDMARDMQMVLIAASEGAKAGVVINEQLLKREWKS